MLDDHDGDYDGEDQGDGDADDGHDAAQAEHVPLIILLILEKSSLDISCHCCWVKHASGIGSFIFELDENQSLLLEHYLPEGDGGPEGAGLALGHGDAVPLLLVIVASLAADIIILDDNIFFNKHREGLVSCSEENI